MDNKRWYIITYSAENDGYSLVHLTDDEAEIVREALSSPVEFGGGYCGSARLSTSSWYCKDSAVEVLLNCEEFI